MTRITISTSYAHDCVDKHAINNHIAWRMGAVYLRLQRQAFSHLATVVMAERLAVSAVCSCDFKLKDNQSVRPTWNYFMAAQPTNDISLRPAGANAGAIVFLVMFREQLDVHT